VARLAPALTSLWWILGYGEEGLHYLEPCLAELEANDTDATVFTIRLSAMAAAYSCHRWHLFDRLRTGFVEVARTRTDDVGAMALGFFGAGEWSNPQHGIELIDEAIRRLSPSNRQWIPVLGNFAGELLLVTGKFEDANARYEQIRRLHIVDVDPWWEASALGNSALAQLIVGSRQEGLSLAQRSMARAVSDPASTPLVRATAVLAVALAMNGAFDDATTLLLAEIARLQGTTRQELRLAVPLGAAAFVLSARGQLSEARELMAYMTRERFNIAAPWQAVVCELARRQIHGQGKRQPQTTAITGTEALDLAVFSLANPPGAEKSTSASFS
jgi:hypothetical protein